MTTFIGPYVQGEIPEPLEYQYLDDAGDPIDLNGFTATFTLETPQGQASLPAAVATPAEGKVRHTWLAGELDAGVCTAEFIATSTAGATKLHSDRILAYVAAAV